MRDDFGIADVHPVKAALTHKQVQEMDLHTDFTAKRSDSRYKKFVDRYGEDVYELESVDPGTLQRLLTEAIDSVIERKIDALVRIESQFIEGGAMGSADKAPKNAAEKEARIKQVRESFKRRFTRIADDCRDKLIDLYGEDAGKKVKYAEAYEICEYGRRPSKQDLKKLFPFLLELK